MTKLMNLFDLNELSPKPVEPIPLNELPPNQAIFPLNKLSPKPVELVPRR